MRYQRFSVPRNRNKRIPRSSTASQTSYAFDVISPFPMMGYCQWISALHLEPHGSDDDAAKRKIVVLSNVQKFEGNGIHLLAFRRLYKSYCFWQSWGIFAHHQCMLSTPATWKVPCPQWTGTVDRSCCYNGTASFLIALKAKLLEHSCRTVFKELFSLIGGEYQRLSSSFSNL